MHTDEERRAVYDEAYLIAIQSGKSALGAAFIASSAREAVVTEDLMAEQRRIDEVAKRKAEIIKRDEERKFRVRQLESALRMQVYDMEHKGTLQALIDEIDHEYARDYRSPSRLELQRDWFHVKRIKEPKITFRDPNDRTPLNISSKFRDLPSSPKHRHKLGY